MCFLSFFRTLAVNSISLSVFVLFCFLAFEMFMPLLQFLLGTSHCCTGVKNIPWLGNLDNLCPASLVPTSLITPVQPQTLPHFPVRPGEKRSYAQSCVVWIKDSGLQVSVLCILVCNSISDCNSLSQNIFVDSPELCEKKNRSSGSFEEIQV